MGKPIRRQVRRIRASGGRSMMVEMKVFTLSTQIWLDRPVREVFRFFSDARNLEVLTPPWLRFEVLSKGPIDLAEGRRIDYRLRLRGLPVKWQSEITTWKPPRLFVDEQRRGPYRLWVHEHRFTEHGDATLAEDLVRYAVPGGWIINRLLVRRDLERIFRYRRSKLRSLFGDRLSSVDRVLDSRGE